MRRKTWSNLNGEWEFGTGEEPRFDRRITVPFCPESALSGIRQPPGDVVWYRRRFRCLPAECQLLHFGAVDYRATVWVNDVEVARHEGGHTPFSADISAAVHEGDNVVVVRAEDGLADKTIPRGKQYWSETPEGIFYTPTTGIWQTVWLEPVSARHIRSLEFIPDLPAGAVDVTVDADGELELTARLHNAVVGRWSGSAQHARVQLERIVPWSPDSPTLYQVEARLLDSGGRPADAVQSYFGLRAIGTEAGSFLLNGRPFVQRLVLDQGYFPGGLLTAATDADLRRDIELAKAFGFNGARKHQKLEDPRWLYWADVLGFLVWEEMPSFHEYSPLAEARLCAEWREALLRDRSHPCVIAWVPANESFGLESLDDSGRAAFLARLYTMTKGTDQTRPVVSNDGWEQVTTDLCTLHDYGAPAELRRRYRTLESTLEPGAGEHRPFLPGYAYGGQPIIVSELGGLKLGATTGWGYREVHEPAGLVETYRELVKAVMDPGPVDGFCYTQLADIEQEQNGLLTAERTPKIDPELLRPITQMPKRR